VDFAEDLLTFHFRWNVEKYRKAVLSSSEIYARGFDAYYSSAQNTQESPITTVLINWRIALMGVPGEPFVDFQVRRTCSSFSVLLR
jgi:hypothetical protein